MSTPDFADILFQLLPPGSGYSREDLELQNILQALSKEFARYVDWVAELAGSIPDDQCTILKERWADILGTDNLHAKLVERGLYVGNQLVTNTLAHFKRVIEVRGLTADVSSSKPFSLQIKGIPWQGPDSRRNTEASAELAQALIALKHAHLWVTFPEKNDASN